MFLLYFYISLHLYCKKALHYSETWNLKLHSFWLQEGLINPSTVRLYKLYLRQCGNDFVIQIYTYISYGSNIHILWSNVELYSTTNHLRGSKMVNRWLYYTTHYKFIGCMRVVLILFYMGSLLFYVITFIWWIEFILCSRALCFWVLVFSFFYVVFFFFFFWDKERKQWDYVICLLINWGVK